MKTVDFLAILIMAILLAYSLVYTVNTIKKLKRDNERGRRIQMEFIGAYLDASTYIAGSRLDRVHGIAKSCYNQNRGVSLFELTSLIVDSQEKVFQPSKDYTVPFLFDIFDADSKEQDPEAVYEKVYAFIASRGEEVLLQEVFRKYDEIVTYFFESGTTEQHAEELSKISAHLLANGLSEGSLFHALAVKVRNAASGI